MSVSTVTVPCLRPVGIANVLPNSSTTASGTRVGGDVEVGRHAAEQHVAHAAADQVRLVARAAQLLADRQHVGRHPLAHRRGHGFSSRSIASSAAAAAPCSASFFDRPIARP